MYPHPILFNMSDESFSAEQKKSGEIVSPWNVPLLIGMTLVSMSPSFVCSYSTIYHACLDCFICFMITNAILFVVSVSMTCGWGILWKAFRELIQAIFRPLSYLRLFPVMAIFIISWFLPPCKPLQQHPFCSSKNRLFSSRCLLISCKIEGCSILKLLAFSLASTSYKPPFIRFLLKEISFVSNEEKKINVFVILNMIW